MPSYAALLRECADTLAQSDGSLARVRKAEQLNSLAALLERVTPEGVRELARCMEDGVVPEPAGIWCLNSLNRLAAGPQGEA